MSFSGTEIKDLMVGLAEVCDHAVKRDHVGFSKATAPSGHYLSLMEPKDYKREHIDLATSIAKTHMKQLGLSPDRFPDDTPKLRDINSFVHIPHIYCNDDEWEMYCTKNDSIFFKLASYIAINDEDKRIVTKEVGHGYRFGFKNQEVAFQFASTIIGSASDDNQFLVKNATHHDRINFPTAEHILTSRKTRYIIVMKDENYIQVCNAYRDDMNIRITCDIDVLSKSVTKRVDGEDSLVELTALTLPNCKKVMFTSNSTVTDLYNHYIDFKKEATSMLDVSAFFTNFKPKTKVEFIYYFMDEYFSGERELRDLVEPHLRKNVKDPNRVQALLNKVKSVHDISKNAYIIKISASPALILSMIDLLKSMQIKHNYSSQDIDHLKAINDYVEDYHYTSYKSERMIVTNVERSTVSFFHPGLTVHSPLLREFSYAWLDKRHSIPCITAKLDSRFYNHDMAAITKIRDELTLFLSEESENELQGILDRMKLENPGYDETIPVGYINFSIHRKSLLVAEFMFSYEALGQIKTLPYEVRHFTGRNWEIDLKEKSNELIDQVHSTFLTLGSKNWEINPEVFAYLEELKAI